MAERGPAAGKKGFSIPSSRIAIRFLTARPYASTNRNSDRIGRIFRSFVVKWAVACTAIAAFNGDLAGSVHSNEFLSDCKVSMCWSISCRIRMRR